MEKIARIANGHFTVNGKPFFYFADTVWSAFYTTSLADWDQYLDYRRMQYFNVLQMSVLPILNDFSDTSMDMLPFHLHPDGTWDFSNMNDEYFERAEVMLEMACKQGFIPALTLLWCCYVPGPQWGSPAYMMPKEALEGYASYVMKRFAKFHPIYFLGGDTPFETQETIDYYLDLLNTVKRLDPDALTAVHLFGNFHKLPDVFVHSPQLDFYIYQSGHKQQRQDDHYLIAEKFMEMPVKRPLLNSEACYEGHGYLGRYGRFDAFDIRKSFWWSVLSGAKAGYAYGAHGVWSMHRTGAAFKNKEWSKMPYDWRSALRLPGAWDVSFSKWVFEQYELFDIMPGNEYLLTEQTDIRMAVSPDMQKFAIYVPYSIEVSVKLDLSDYDVVMMDLAEKNALQPSIVIDGNSSTVAMCPLNTDVLLIGKMK